MRQIDDRADIPGDGMPGTRGYLTDREQENAHRRGGAEGQVLVRAQEDTARQAHSNQSGGHGGTEPRQLVGPKSEHHPERDVEKPKEQPVADVQEHREVELDRQRHPCGRRFPPAQQQKAPACQHGAEGDREDDTRANPPRSIR